MKRFITTICFVAFLSAGLVSCADNADDVTPIQPELNELSTGGDDSGPKTRP